MFDAHLGAVCAGVIAVGMVSLWLLSLRLRDVSIVDIFWGAGFVLVSWLGLALGHGAVSRRVLLAGITTVWGLRLAGYLAWRNLGHGEDPRYQAMRRRIGPRFAWVSLGMVFGLQGVLMWLVSLPVQVGQSAVNPVSLGWTDALGAVLALTGVMVESVGDLQLARFKADPQNVGRVMDQGLWRYTRHPNYFGDFCVWWGLWGIAAGTPVGFWTVLSPAMMSVLLLRVSGVTLLEASLKKRRPGYEDYVRRTSTFFPWPPRP